MDLLTKFGFTARDVLAAANDRIDKLKGRPL
jgi:hypothetical protein